MASETKRQRQAIETRLRITRAAILLIKERGYEAVTVKDICAAAELSIGAFYHHFGSKEDIINEGHAQVDAMLSERLPSFDSVAWREFIIALMRETGRLLTELGWFFIAQAYRHMLSTADKYTLSQDRQVYGLVSKAVARGLAEGELNPSKTAEAYTDDILRWVRGIIFDWCLREGAYDLGERMETDLRLLFAAMATVLV